MATATELMGLGFSAAQANALASAPSSTAVSAAGSTQTDATLLTTAFVEFTTVSSGQGGRLQPASGQPQVQIYNGGANAVKIYPAAGEYMNGSQNAAFSVTNGKSATFTANGNRWIAKLSA
jgi:hypothetical protein